jgi:hypothetical protein
MYDRRGGCSIPLRFWFIVKYPPSIVSRTIAHLSPTDPGLISINLLEYAMVILAFAGAIAAWEDLPVQDRPSHPIFLLWCDNTSAESWRSKRRIEVIRVG